VRRVTSQALQHPFHMPSPLTVNKYKPVTQHLPSGAAGS